MENPKKLAFPGRTDHFLVKAKRATDKEEVEDMANCLMLLSRGKNLDPSEIDGRDYQTVDRDYQTADRGYRTVNRGSKFYRCKTCDKVFESFQALGGHRASHKKPGKASLILPDCLNPNPNPKPKPKPSPKGGHGSGVGIKLATNKVHECSICGSVFGSGQALGGHMRRHRPVNADVASSGESYKKARSNSYVLELDLNLPAPEDSDSGESLSYGFGFAIGGLPLLEMSD